MTTERVHNWREIEQAVPDIEVHIRYNCSAGTMPPRRCELDSKVLATRNASEGALMHRPWMDIVDDD